MSVGLGSLSAPRAHSVPRCRLSAGNTTDLKHLDKQLFKLAGWLKESTPNRKRLLATIRHFTKRWPVAKGGDHVLWQTSLVMLPSGLKLIKSQYPAHKIDTIIYASQWQAPVKLDSTHRAHVTGTYLEQILLTNRTSMPGMLAVNRVLVQ